MRNNILIISALIMLSACSGRQTQTESAEYELTVKGNAVRGVETLSAEGEVEKQDVTLTDELSGQTL